MKRLARWLLVALAALAVLGVIPAIGMGLACRGEATLSSVTRAHILEAVPQEAEGVEISYLRAEPRTYLTFPEWFIVYVSQDYGAWLEENRPSGFPYFSAVWDFWSSYCGVTRVTTARYPTDWGAHVMIYVIGVSHSIEYLAKGIYENTLGRLFEWLAFGARTEEETYAARAARHYGAFLNETPWYEYPFTDHLSGLWRDTSLAGAGIVRKWERKLVLSAEYGIKAVYGAAIRAATGAAYAPAELEILLVTDPLPHELLIAEPAIEVVYTLEGGAQLIKVPRYAEFTRLLKALADAGVGIREIAGNGEILVTALVPVGGGTRIDSAERIFSMSLATEGERDRIGYRVPVAMLARTIGEIEAAGGTFEHAYDY